MNVLRNLVLISLFLLSNNFIFGQKTMSVALSASDTGSIPIWDDAANYTGWRVELTDVRLVKFSKKNIKFKATLTNTGRLPVNLGKFRKGGEQIPMILFDADNLATQGLGAYHDQIRYAVLQIPVTLAEGKTLDELNIEIIPIPNTKIPEPTAEKPIVVATPAEIAAAKSVQKPNLPSPPVVTPKPSEVLPRRDSTQFVGHKVLPIDTILPTGFVSLEDAEQEVLRLDSIERAKQNAEKLAIENRNTNNILKPVSKTKEQIEKEEKEALAKREKEAKIAPPQYPTPAPIPKDTTPKNNGFVEEKIDLASGCADLIIDGVRMVERSDKFVKIEVNIFNKGNRDANIYGATKALDDNVAIRFFASGTPRLTRGSLPVENIQLNDGLKATKGVLESKKSLKQVFKIPTDKFNRFNKMLLIQIDGFDVLRECDETNNVNYLILDF